MLIRDKYVRWVPLIQGDLINFNSNITIDIAKFETDQLDELPSKIWDKLNPSP